MGDLDIYYSSLASPHSVDCWCSRWDVKDFSIVIETFLNKSDFQTIQDHTVPGAVGELYKVLGRPVYYDKTWNGENTLMFSPNTTAQSRLKSMREDTIIYVKNITSSPIEGSSGLIMVKIEGYISGTGD